MDLAAARPGGTDATDRGSPPTTQPAIRTGIPAAGRRRSAQVPLSRRRILRAALRLVDAEGLDAVSMRRLAAGLDVTPRALYRYVADKADLLGGVGDAVLRELRQPPHDAQPWTARVTWMLGELRRVLVAHPNVVPLFATRASASPAVARTAEVAVGALRQAGFDDQTTVRAFCALFSYVLGFVVVEAGRPTPASATAEARCRARAEQLATLDPGELLRMATVAPAMAGFVPEEAFASDTQFTYGLKLLVGALERQLAPSGTAYPRSRAGDAG